MANAPAVSRDYNDGTAKTRVEERQSAAQQERGTERSARQEGERRNAEMVSRLSNLVYATRDHSLSKREQSRYLVPADEA